MEPLPLYETKALRDVTGSAIRPGGLTLTEKAAAWCAFPPGSRVLDVGCGPGATLAHLRQVHHWSAAGLDPSRLLLSEGHCGHPDLPLVQGRAESLPFRDGAFQGVFCECVLSLLEDRAAVLSEFWRVLTDGGLLIMTDLYIRELRAGFNPAPSAGCLAGAMTREELNPLIDAAGFSRLLWEDHSPLLRELAARLIWAHGSTAAFGAAACARGTAGCAQETSTPGRPGYFLMAAQKEKPHE